MNLKRNLNSGVLSMPDFCPECDNLLRKKNENGKIFLICKCGFQKELEQNSEKLNSSIQKKKKELEKKLIIISEEDKVSVHLKTKKNCPKCGFTKAETWQVQIRGADEPMTHFFKCVKCKYTWREN